MSRKLSFKIENKIQTCPGEQGQNYDQIYPKRNFNFLYFKSILYIYPCMCGCVCVSQHTLEVRG